MMIHDDPIIGSSSLEQENSNSVIEFSSLLTVSRIDIPIPNSGLRRSDRDRNF
jgi:hypothetical protein